LQVVLFSMAVCRRKTTTCIIFVAVCRRKSPLLMLEDSDRFNVARLQIIWCLSSWVFQSWLCTSHKNHENSLNATIV
jgi:hypothetical protein